VVVERQLSQQTNDMTILPDFISDNPALVSPPVLTREADHPFVSNPFRWRDNPHR
jgi:hypothetical protein